MQVGRDRRPGYESKGEGRPEAGADGNVDGQRQGRGRGGGDEGGCEGSAAVVAEKGVGNCPPSNFEFDDICCGYICTISAIDHDRGR